MFWSFVCVDVIDDDDWFNSLTNTFVVDQEANANSIQPVDDPNTDSYAKKLQDEEAAEVESIEAQQEVVKKKADTSAIDETLADITKEVKKCHFTFVRSNQG